MRYSCLENDPGFKAYREALSKGLGVRVYHNGARVVTALTADEDAGTVARWNGPDLAGEVRVELYPLGGWPAQDDFGAQKPQTFTASAPRGLGAAIAKATQGGAA